MTRESELEVSILTKQMKKKWIKTSGNETVLSVAELFACFSFTRGNKLPQVRRLNFPAFLKCASNFSYCPPVLF